MQEHSRASEQEAMPALNGIVETALYVTDLRRSRDFYERVFGFVAVGEGERLTALAIRPGQVLLLCLKGASASLGVTAHDASGQIHLAFAVGVNELPEWERQLAEMQVDVVHRRRWPRGGESVYFRDPDGHLLELATPGVWSNY